MTLSSIKSQMTSRRISPRYLPEMSFCNRLSANRKGHVQDESTSNACSAGLLEDSSTMISYFVRGRCSCLNESKAPWKRGCQTWGCQSVGRFQYPFAVDSDLCIIRKSETFQLGYLLDGFHVGCIASSTENDGNLGIGINVG